MKLQLVITFSLIATLFLAACTTNQYKRLEIDNDFIKQYIESGEIIYIETEENKITPIKLTRHKGNVLVGIDQDTEQEVEIALIDIGSIYTDDGPTNKEGRAIVAGQAGAITQAALMVIILLFVIYGMPIP
jgi:starvation-inducible outer membrane lipoprotein